MAAFDLSSPAFGHDAEIPVEYTCDGADRAPALTWRHPPAGTQGFALSVEDPDAPGGTFVHWVLYDIPAHATGLTAGETPPDARSGRNDFGRTGYGGPCPPPGHGAHHYHFTLYALDLSRLDLPPGVSLPRLRQAMQGHVLSRAELIGWYAREAR